MEAVHKKAKEGEDMKKEHFTGFDLGICYLKAPLPTINDDRPDPT